MRALGAKGPQGQRQGKGAGLPAGGPSYIPNHRTTEWARKRTAPKTTSKIHRCSRGAQIPLPPPPSPGPGDCGPSVPYILESLEAAPPVTLATRSWDSSTFRSSSCLSSSSFFLPRRSRALILAYVQEKGLGHMPGGSVSPSAAQRDLHQPSPALHPRRGQSQECAGLARGNRGPGLRRGWAASPIPQTGRRSPGRARAPLLAQAGRGRRKVGCGGARPFLTVPHRPGW